MTLVAFWAFASLAILGALATVSRRNPVSAAAWLVFTLCATSGLYLSLHATFLAAIQVLVYAGAIIVLFLFVVMALGSEDKPKMGFFRDLRSGPFTKLLALAVILSALAPLVYVFWAAPAGTATAPAVQFGDVKSIGRVLFSSYVLPFEAISILLLVSIVGAVMITRRVSKGRPPFRAAPAPSAGDSTSARFKAKRPLRVSRDILDRRRNRRAPKEA